MRVPEADPTKPRKLRRTLLEPIALSKAGRWYLMRIAPPLDRVLAAAIGGRLTSLPMPMVYLTHTGARSGIARTTPLLYFTDGDDVILMASNYGRSGHPAWLHNVRANPDVELLARGRRGRYRARVPEGAERDRLWELAKGYTRAYSDYEQRAAGREIQVVACAPLDPA